MSREWVKNIGNNIAVDLNLLFRMALLSPLGEGWGL